MFFFDKGLPLLQSFSRLKECLGSRLQFHHSHHGTMDMLVTRVSIDDPFNHEQTPGSPRPNKEWSLG